MTGPLTGVGASKKSLINGKGSCSLNENGLPEVGVMFWKKKNFTHTCKFPGALELYRRLWHAHTPGKSQVTWKFTGPEKIQGTWNFSGPLDYFRSPGNFQGAPNFTLDEQCEVAEANKH